MDRQTFIDKVDTLVQKKKEERQQEMKREEEEKKKRREQTKRKFEVILETAIDGAIEDNELYYIYEFKDNELYWWVDGFNKFLKENNLSHKVEIERQKAKPGGKYIPEIKEGIIITFK